MPLPGGGMHGRNPRATFTLAEPDGTYHGQIVGFGLSRKYLLQDVGDNRFVAHPAAAFTEEEKRNWASHEPGERPAGHLRTVAYTGTDASIEIRPVLISQETAMHADEGWMTPEQVDEKREHMAQRATAEKSQRSILIIPYREKDEAKDTAKRAGFRIEWDKDAKAWTAPPGVDLAVMAKWLPENRPNAVQKVGEQEIQDEFGAELRKAGLLLEKGHWIKQEKVSTDSKPMMDGQRYRVPVEGDKGNERSGVYIGHLDGHPSGYIQNFKTGERTNWKASHAVERISDADRDRVRAEAAERVAERAAAQEAQHARTAQALEGLVLVSPPADPQHPYLVAKGLAGDTLLRQVPDDARDLPADSPVRIAKTATDAAKIRKAEPEAIVLMAGSLIVPAHDRNGALTTIQTISANGQKNFALGGKLAESYYSAVRPGHGDAASTKGAIIIAEGWATGESISRATGAHVVVAFNAGNLEAVAKAMREQYPDRPIVIAADNDTGLEAKGKANVGKNKAEAAATAVAGHAVSPPGQVDGKSQDWNDVDKSQGNQAVKKAMLESIAIADRKMIADARYTGHDATRAAEVVTLHQADMQRTASSDKNMSEQTKQQAAATYTGLRDRAEAVAESEQENQESADKPAGKGKSTKRQRQKSARNAGADAGY